MLFADYSLENIPFVLGWVSLTSELSVGSLVFEESL